MTLASDTALLAQALAELLAAGGERPAALRGAEPPIALAARDILLTALRGRAVEVERLTARSPAKPPLRPAVADLRAALYQLPLAASAPMPLRQAISAPTTASTRRWQQAARAATTLELHHGRPQPADVPAAAGALAQLTAALPVLDGDLAAALPSDPRGIPAALTADQEHQNLTAAAAALAERTSNWSGNDKTGVHELPTVPRVRPVRGLHDVPNATRHLAALLDRRGADLTLREVRAVARLLATGHQLAARILPGIDPALLAAARSLYQLQDGQAATLGRPAPPILILAGEVRHHLRQHAEQPSLPTTATEQQQLRDTTANWLPAAAAAAHALHAGLRDAAAAGNLYVPSQGARGRHPDLLWQRARIDTELPLLTAARTASDVATHLARQHRSRSLHPDTTAVAVGRLQHAVAGRQATPPSPTVEPPRPPRLDTAKARPSPRR